MSHEIKIPPVGESVTSALVAQWHKEEGDHVQKGDILVTLETDKVSNELEAEISGTLSITVPEGEEVAIGTVVGMIAEGAVTSAPPAQSPVKKPEEPNSAPAREEKGEVVPIIVPAAGESITSATVAAWSVTNGSYIKKGEVMVTLDTDKVSTELEAEVAGTIKIEVSEGSEVAIGATLGTLTTGPVPEGIKEEKGVSPAQKTQEKAPPQATPTPTAKKVVMPPTEEGRFTRKKMTPLRRKISQHLVNAQQTAAILTTFNEADMSAVMKLRKQVQEDFIAKHGVKLGFMSFFIKSVVQALKEVPSINARIEETDIIENHFFDIGVAIGTEKGLVVPVLRDCDQKSFAQIEQDIIDYAMKARDGKIELSDLSGGVFTVSNGGVYGSLLSTPILNPPQSGILGMHTIQQRPMAVNGEVKILPMMYLAMSYDHRLVDGKEAVTFLISVKNSIENPTRLMLEM
jgi:2-oxoglutarate dehydrogenase E2 component (dihydrolipoamide succinyltransferase)